MLTVSFSQTEILYPSENNYPIPTSHQPLATTILLSVSIKAKAAQPFPTLCDCMDYIVRGILQARILEWVAVPFSRGSS